MNAIEQLERAKEFNLEPVIRRYKNKNGLDDLYMTRMQDELMKWLVMCTFPNAKKYSILGPVDDLWHEFITFTYGYFKFCNHLGVDYIHHHPSNPYKTNEDGENTNEISPELIESYALFKSDYEKLFNEVPSEKFWPDLNNYFKHHNDPGGCQGGGMWMSTRWSCMAMMIDGKDIDCQLHSKGYYLSESLYTYDQCRKIAHMCGKILDESDVKLKKGTELSVLNTRDPIYFHVDVPIANKILWYCYEEGYPDEFVLLSLKMKNPFTKLELALLEDIYPQLPADYKIRNPILRAYESFPVFSSLAGERIKLNYTPWLEYGLLNEDETNVLNKLKSLVEEIVSTVTEIWLKKGQILVVDNSTVLHSRSLLAEHTLRHHIRFLLG